MTVKIGINGFGRIGRNIFRLALQNDKIDVVAVNDLTEPDMLAHLLKYDSVHGRLSQDVELEGDRFIIGGKAVKLMKQADPKDIEWEKYDVDIVIEATGH